MKKGSILVTAALCLLGGTPRTLQASDNLTHKIDLKPALLRGSDKDAFALAGKFDTWARYDLGAWDRGPSGFLKLRTTGTVATDSRAHSESIVAEFLAGTAVELTRPGTPIPPPAPGEFSPGWIPPTPTGGAHYGNIELMAKVGFETDQPLDNYSLTCGPHLGYVHRNSQDGLWPLVPLVQADFVRVDVLKSKAFEDRGISEDSFWRSGLTAEWNWQAGDQLAHDSRFLRPIGVHARMSYYKSFDLPGGATKADLDESAYVSGGLSYRFTALNHKWLRNAFVTVAHGRIPPAVEEQTMVFVGVALGPNRGR